MSTEEKKAKELIEKFMYELMDIANVRARFPIAKQCAAICVQELMENEPLNYEIKDGTYGKATPVKSVKYQYWQEVLNHINSTQ